VISNSVNAYFALLFGVAGGGQAGECLPYSKPPHLAADLTLSTPTQRMPNLAADDHLCEKLV
jgi:hypothetical protein